MNTERPPAPPPPFLPPDERFRREYEWPLIKVQGTVIATLVVLGITVLFGLLRSRVSNPLMKTLATVLFFPGANKLISFVPGLMELNHKYDLFVFWLAFLTYLGAVANTYSCYRFEDNEDRRISLFMDYIFPWGTIVFSLCKDLIGPEVFVPVLVMFWMVLLKFRERRDALYYATRSNFGLVEATKVIHDFMMSSQGKTDKNDDVERGEDDLPVDKRNTEQPNFRYLVGVKDARSTFDEDCYDDGEDNFPTGYTPSRGLLWADGPQSSLITLDKIVDLKVKLGSFLLTRKAERLQETCFSFALFWMLLAKLAGHEVRTDAYKELFRSPNDVDEERIFNIIEVEINFLYQYFYTNYYAIYIKGLKSKFWHLCIVILFLWLALPLLFLYRPEDHSVIYVDISDRVVDKGITRFIIIVILLVELAHNFLVLTSNWAKIIYLCHYVKTNGSSKITELAIKYSTRFSFSFKATKIAQYSLAECYNSTPRLMWLAYIIQELRVMDIPEVGQHGVQYIRLQPDLKNTFVRFIKKSVESNNRKISNGATVLYEAGELDEAWALDLIKKYIHCFHSHSEVILIWHLATHYLQGVGSSEEGEHKRVATTLSEYCAYLVVFASRFVPDGGYVAQCIFKQARTDVENNKKEIMELKQKQSSNSDKRNIDDIAIELQKELVKINDGRLWKVLAEFWTEMILYLSLANNFEAIEAHLDYLCTGGELITHLWALLNHAGCYRDPEAKPKIKTRENE